MSEPDLTAWDAWGAARPATPLLHLDSAACGRPSRGTLAAEIAHLAAEAERGGYVAEAEAEKQLSGLRRDVAAVLGTDAEGVAFLESATHALETLLRAWPLPEGAVVGVPATEWGPNLEILAHHGLGVELLDVESTGVIDLERFAVRLARAPLDLVLIDQVAAHRGLVQPVESVTELARAHGVAVWVDAAQAVGHVEVVAGDAVFATGRKWLCGPRGVGLLGVSAEHRSTLRARLAAKRPDLPPLRRLESEEAHLAGRIGLGVAVREFLDLGAEAVPRRLREVGARTREAVAEISGWEVLHPEAPAAATTTLVPTDGQDVVRARERLLLDHQVLTTVILPWRSPSDPVFAGAPGPMLRVSPHVDLTDEDLARLCRGLASR